jgi:hypothetical protein
MLYLVVVGLTMLALPLGSIAIEWRSGASLLWLAGKWFVFWSVGVRLSLAGLRQYAQPAFTSRDILGIEGSAAYPLVRELGGANLAAGVVGLASIAFPSFVLPSALGAGLFYVVAAIEHLKSKHASFNERVALVSDVFIAVVLLGFVAGAWARGLS